MLMTDSAPKDLSPAAELSSLVAISMAGLDSDFVDRASAAPLSWSASATGDGGGRPPFFVAICSPAPAEDGALVSTVDSNGAASTLGPGAFAGGLARPCS